MTVEEIYKEEYVPAWEDCHEEGEPACFEEWKGNDFKESLENFIDDMSYQQKVAIMMSYCQNNRTCSFPYPDYMESIDECGTFSDLYDKIDHDNFNDLYNNDYILDDFEYEYEE